MPNPAETYDSLEAVYEELPGWKEDLSTCSTFEELPTAAQVRQCICFLYDVPIIRDVFQNYVETIEKLIGIPVVWVSGTSQFLTAFELSQLVMCNFQIGVGAERGQIIYKTPTQLMT